MSAVASSPLSSSSFSAALSLPYFFSHIVYVCVTGKEKMYGNCGDITKSLCEKVGTKQKEEMFPDVTTEHSEQSSMKQEIEFNPLDDIIQKLILMSSQMFER